MDVSELLARYAAGERDFRRVDLSGVNLSDAHLSGVKLNEADLSNANLCSTYLWGAELIATNLSNVNLNYANLSSIKLFEANLCQANLCFTDLSRANLCLANLSSANLTNAYLSRAKLHDANLSGANLTNAELRDADLSFANLSDANLTNVNLTNANLVEANFTNAILTGAILDGTILVYQNIAEKLQQENQTLTERVKLLEEQLEKKLTQDLNTASNQGINGRYKWNNFYFRSKTEIKIAEALDLTGVLFYPNSKARLNKAELRVNKESDFLVFHSGKFGILEVDGRDYHQIAADDHERDRLFKRHGIRVIERFDATRCWNEPEQVVQEFLEILSQA